MTGLYWPPRNGDDLRAWQKIHGIDAAIAAAVGVSNGAVFNWRKEFGVPPVERPKTKQRSDRMAKDGEPIAFSDPREGARPRLTEEQITDIYDDRTYADVVLDFQDRAVKTADGAAIGGV